jgi:hypothetical protein
VIYLVISVVSVIVSVIGSEWQMKGMAEAWGKRAIGLTRVLTQGTAIVSIYILEGLWI